ncbi:MAG: glycosyltransferase family 2 protein [Lachnospiraceae bacterium]|nr:glycosyltransferase family 2 protein [Lachnospiraceae bacterium]
MTIDVIIPIYKPGKELFRLLDMLEKQTKSVNRIILMNTEESNFEPLIYGTDFWNRYKNVQVFHLSKKEFDHGRTRHMGVQKSDADVFVMMTQDAMPTDEYLIENLTSPLSGQIAVSYARQLPGEHSDALERVSRSFNYPPESMTKGMVDLERLGIKTYFCSNVCAAYRREIYEELGGFIRHTIFNEDMIYAAGAVRAGYSIAYVAEATVVHAHNYTCMQQLRRNFDLGVSQADCPRVFKDVKSESEGKRLVQVAGQQLREQRAWGKLLHFYMQCAFKYAGYLLGKHYALLPMPLVLKITMNREYWNKK